MKPKRNIDKKYSKFIESLPCLVSNKECMGDIVGHHWQMKGHGGRGTKADDKRRVPMCCAHHDEIHRKGRQTFAEKYNVPIEDLIERLNNVWELVNDDNRMV